MINAKKEGYAMSTIVEPEHIVKKYVDLYKGNRELISREEPDFVTGYRDEAITRFDALGFPARKAEDYKYLHLEPFFNGGLTTFLEPRKLEFDVEDVFRCDIPELQTHVLLVLNGHYYTSSGEKLHEDEQGVIFGSLAEAWKKHPGLVKKHYAKHADFRNDSFVALNTSCARDGIFIYIPENTKMEKPIQIIHLLLSTENELVQHRNLFVAERNSSADIIVCDHTLSAHLFLTNSVTEISSAENAHIDVVRLQNEHNQSVQITNTWINQEKHSEVKHSTITLHGGQVRNNLRVRLNGEQAHCDARGLFLSDRRQHVDNFTVIEHRQPHCTSNQHYKGVLDDMSTGAFSGKIHVFPDAQKTEAFQSNNNMLLTHDAKMHTKPQLEIYADDVKCSHGATVGQIDEDAMFYLRSRGIPHDEARLMLMYAFADEVISGIKEEVLQARVSELISKRLRGELARCDSCAVHCHDD